jgi:hypothetical protein
MASHRHKRPPPGFCNCFQAVAVVAAMTITTAITIKMGSVPRLTCKRARHVGALPPAHNFPLRILFPRLTNADKWEPMPLRPNGTNPPLRIFAVVTRAQLPDPQIRR